MKAHLEAGEPQLQVSFNQSKMELFPAMQGRKDSAVAMQTSHTDGHMHQSEAPGGVGGAGDAQANAAHQHIYILARTQEKKQKKQNPGSWRADVRESARAVYAFCDYVLIKISFNSCW